MKALVYTGVETLSFDDVQDPIARDGEVLVKIDSVGICGSDMHAFLGHDRRRPAPRPPAGARAQTRYSAPRQARSRAPHA